jgi:hypothetical protein
MCFLLLTGPAACPGSLIGSQVTGSPQPLPASLAWSVWEGMSGTVVFATDSHDGEQAVGVITTHHRPEAEESALTIVPITAATGPPTAEEWWRQLGVIDPDALPVQPPLSVAAQRRSRLSGGGRSSTLATG